MYMMINLYHRKLLLHYYYNQTNLFEYCVALQDTAYILHAT